MTNENNQVKKKTLSVKNMAKISVLGAVSVIIMLFEFPLPFAPSFYKLDLSEAVILIGGFAMGPFAAAAIELIKVLLNLLINGTITAGVGEFANFLIGCSMTVPAAWIYYRHKSRKTAVTGMIAGTLIMTVVGAVLNCYLLLPVYAAAFKMPIDSLVAMGTALNPSITSLWGFVLLAVVPFNLVKGVVVSILALLLYKRVSPILHR